MKMTTFARKSIWLLVVICGPVNRNLLFANDEPAVQMRQPVAIAVIDDGRTLATANRRSGTISLVDTHDRTVEREISVGSRLSDIVATNDSKWLLITDEATHELIAVRRSSEEYRVEKRLAISPYPVTVRVNPEGTRAYVASLWSRTISVVDLTKWLSEPEKPDSAILHQISLPFSPREQVVVDVSEQRQLSHPPAQLAPRLIVADAFGSKIALVDPELGQVLAVREIPGHAIRGMQRHPTKHSLMITHQLLNRIANTTTEDIHWGSLMLNCLHTLDLEDVLDPKADLLKRSAVEYIGGPDRGAGDPAGFVINPDGFIGIAVSGTDEFVVDEGRNLLFTTRLKTGTYPTAVAHNPDYSEAYIVNSFSDSITVIQLTKMKVAATISLGAQPELTSVDRGERLFHSAKLSHERWISCASCHVDGHTNGLLNDNFTDRTFGTAKRVLSLRGVAQTAPYAWSGRFATLAEQIGHSVESTMQGRSLTDAQTSDLEAYLNTLAPAPASELPDKVTVAAGAVLFERLDCRRCHSPPTFTSPRIVDVELQDEQGASKFNPPSLRGVSQNAPYFHDGRAKSLEDVFQKFRHQLDRELSDEELRQLIAFLKSI